MRKRSHSLNLDSPHNTTKKTSYGDLLKGLKARIEKRKRKLKDPVEPVAKQQNNESYRERREK